MRKASERKAPLEGSETEGHDFEEDLKRAKETLDRLRLTVEELHETVRRVEKNLQRAKASAHSRSSLE